MNKKITSIIILAGLFCLSSVAFADVTIPDPLGGVTFDQLLLKIADGVGKLIAGLGTIMIVIAGILYLTSAGSPEKINKAKTALTYAVIGLAIGIAASGIVEIIKGVIGVK